MTTQIQPGANVLATDGPLGQVITVVPGEEQPDAIAFLVVQRTTGSLLTLPATVIAEAPSPDLVRLNVSSELAIEMDRAARGHAPSQGGQSSPPDTVEGLRAMQEEPE